MKNLVRNNIGYISASMAFTAFILALVLFFAAPGQDRNRFNISFPDTSGGEHHHEWRLLASEKGVAETVVSILEEMILGPMDLGAIPFIPPETSVQSVMYNRASRVVYIDLSPEVILMAGGDSLGAEAVFDLMRENVVRNVRRIDKIVITIDGQVPGVSRFKDL